MLRTKQPVRVLASKTPVDCKPTKTAAGDGLTKAEIQDENSGDDMQIARPVQNIVNC